MDTRTKIVEPHSIPIGGPVRVIVSYFDPLHAAQVRALRKAAPADAVIVAAIAEPSDPLLPLRARAELAAALDVIDYVVIDIHGAMALPGALVTDIREDDLRRREELMPHVLRRHRSE